MNSIFLKYQIICALTLFCLISQAQENKPPEVKIKPKLYILAVGVSKYRDNSLNMQYAAKDAADFVNIMSKQKGKQYSDVVTKLLIDEEGSKHNILDGLDWIQNETTSSDVAMIFFAGHGVKDNTGNFYYMPADVNFDQLRTTCVSYVDIKQSIVAITGKVILFMDACHSGVMGDTGSAFAGITRITNELTSAKNGVVVFTSTGQQNSFEDPAWQNGAFTKALVEGLAGKADLFSQKEISFKMLDLYISQRVKELTKGQQSLSVFIPVPVSDFPIACVD